MIIYKGPKKIEFLNFEHLLYTIIVVKITIIDIQLVKKFCMYNSTNNCNSYTSRFDTSEKRWASGRIHKVNF